MSARATGTTRRPVRYLALGDSYTIGEAVPPAESFPHRLAAHLARAGYEASPPRILAKTGWTTDELEAAMDDAISGGDRFDLVTLLIGVNDQYRGRRADDYAPAFTRLLERATGFAGGADRVIVASIPDWGVTPYAAGRDRSVIAREIDAFNRANREIVASRGARYVDVTTVSREHGGDTSMLAADGLHPSGAMYRIWSDLLLPIAVDALTLR